MASGILRDLRDLRVHVVHPADDEGKNLVDHLRRIGCTVEAQWPIPDTLPPNTDILMLAIDYEQRDTIRRLSRLPADRATALIAIVDYENPTTLQIVLECGALAVVEKPIRPFGVLTNVVLARTLWLERRDAQRKLQKAENKVVGLQKIQRAKAILMRMQGVSEAEAHENLRRQAMSKRLPLDEMAGAIINANELLTAKTARL